MLVCCANRQVPTSTLSTGVCGIWDFISSSIQRRPGLGSTGPYPSILDRSLRSCLWTQKPFRLLVANTIPPIKGGTKNLSALEVKIAPARNFAFQVEKSKPYRTHHLRIDPLPFFSTSQLSTTPGIAFARSERQGFCCVYCPESPGELKPLEFSIPHVDRPCENLHGDLLFLKI